MTRQELKRRIIAGEPMPGVSDALFDEVLAECCAEATAATGQEHRVVTLMESVQQPQPDHHARMRALLEASDTPRSDLKADDRANPPTAPGGDPYLSPGDLVGAIRRAVAGYTAAGIDINTAPTRQTPLILTESREELAQRIPDPIARAYVILSGRA